MTPIHDHDLTDRRRFLARIAAGAAACLAGTSVLAAGAETTPTATAIGATTGRVTLGATGIETAFVAQGTGSSGWNHTSDQVKLGDRGFERLIRHGLERGQNFLDTADLYGSHEVVKKALAGVPRGDYTLLTKLWPEPASWCTPSGGAKPEIDRFRSELGTDHLDIVLIHCVGTSNWATRYARVRDELSELKSSGVIRAVGVSCHDLGALQAAASDPWVDVILARINHKGGRDWSMDASSDVVADVLRRAHGNQKAVVGMKLFGAGRMTKAADREASLRWVLEKELVDALTIGTTSSEQIDANLEMISTIRAAKG